MARPTTQVTIIGIFMLAALTLIVMMTLAFGSGKWFTRTVSYKVFMDFSVNGLSTGMPVKFRGVKVGQVTDISLSGHLINENDDKYIDDGSQDDKGRHTFPIKVTLELQPESFGFNTNWLIALFTDEGSNVEATKELISKLVTEQGLQVQLKMLSLLTGQKYLELNVSENPLSQETLDERGKLCQRGILTAQATALDRLTGEFSRTDFSKYIGTIYRFMDQVDTFVEDGRPLQIFNRIDAISRHIEESAAKLPDTISATRSVIIDARELASEAADTFARMNEAIDRARRLVENIDVVVADNKDAIPELLKTLQGSLQNADSQLKLLQDILLQLRQDTAPESELRQRLDTLLENCIQASGRLDALLEMLSQNPQALLMGK